MKVPKIAFATLFSITTALTAHAELKISNTTSVNGKPIPQAQQSAQPTPKQQICLGLGNISGSIMMARQNGSSADQVKTSINQVVDNLKKRGMGEKRIAAYSSLMDKYTTESFSVAIQKTPEDKTKIAQQYGVKNFQECMGANQPAQPAQSAK